MDNSSQGMVAPLAAITTDDICFYCGLPFEPVSLPMDNPLYKRFSKYAIKTTMRFYSPRKLDEENEPQFVSAHSWCNCQARRLSYNGRLALKETLTHEVQEQNSPPWQYLEADKIDKFLKRLQKKQLTETLSHASDQCYYCGMPFDIVPVEPSQPFYRKFKSWAKKTVQQSDHDAENKAVLAHQWCSNKTEALSAEQRIDFKTTMTAKCTGPETMPWIDKMRLRKYIQQGGDLMQLLTHQYEMLSNAGSSEGGWEGSSRE